MNTSPCSSYYAGVRILLLVSVFFNLSLFTQADSLVDLAHSGKQIQTLAQLTVSADLEVRDEWGNTALHWAALNRDATLVKELLKHGANVDATNDAKATPLIYSVAQIDSVKALLENGADPNHVSKLGTTPLLAAASCSTSSEVIKLLLKYKADPLAKNSLKLLDAAADNGDLESIKMLLGAGIKPRDVNKSAWRGHIEIVEALLEAGADINAPHSFTGHALNASLYGHSLDVAKLLIEKGADLSVRSPRGQHETPPLVWAAYSETGDANVAKLMLEKGVDVNTATALGDTALDWARDRKNKPLEEVLLKAGAQPGTRKLKKKEIPNHSLPSLSDELDPLIRDSITRAIDLLQLTSDGYLNSGVVQEKKCVSCHQQTLPAITYGWARDRGFELDKVSIARQVQDQVNYWSNNNRIPRSYEMISPQPDASIVVGYGLVGLAALEYPIDSLVEPMARYLSAMQKTDGSWVVNDYRPPMEDGPILGTALATKALSQYPISGISGGLNEQYRKSRKFLRDAVPENFNQEAFRLLGLAWSGEKPRNVTQYVDAIIQKQRPDGGWAQLDGLPSDSWATGIALVALKESGGIKVKDKAYQKGIRFLLRTQYADGSWYVRSRAWPFQPHFESGFPHGKDQWISEGGTAWATMALLLTQPKTDKVEKTDWMAIDVPKLYSKNKTKRSSAVTGAISSVSTIDFRRDIKPLFERSCYGCHSSEAKKIKGDFNIEKRESFLEGGQSFNPVVALGNAEDSDLIWMITDRIEDSEMPPLSKREKSPPLSSSEIELIKSWINEGLNWESE